MKATFKALWRLFHAFIFYPAMAGLFIWLYVKGAHWIFGLGVIVAVLVLDPIWRIMARNILSMISKK